MLALLDGQLLGFLHVAALLRGRRLLMLQAKNIQYKKHLTGGVIT